MIDIFLLRHAKSAPQADKDEELWPLKKPQGIEQAQALVAVIESINPDAIYSSPYERSIQTVRPFTDKYRRPPTIINAFREKKHAIPWGKDIDFNAEIRKFWDDFNHKLPGGESSNDALARFSKAIREVADQRNNKRILLSTHGTVIALFLNSIDPEFGYEQWAEMPMPAIETVSFSNGIFSRTD